jgi:hypothetical protein
VTLTVSECAQLLLPAERNIENAYWDLNPVLAQEAVENVVAIMAREGFADLPEPLRRETQALLKAAEVAVGEVHGMLREREEEGTHAPSTRT